jgi:hypothetical protein
MYVNLYWNGVESIIETFLCYYILKERLTNWQQWSGFVLIVVKLREKTILDSQTNNRDVLYYKMKNHLIYKLQNNLLLLCRNIYRIPYLINIFN